MSFKRVFSFLGILIGFLSLLMIPSAILAGDGVRAAFVWSSVISIALGLLLRVFCRSAGDPKGKDGFGIVVFGWLLSALVCAAPFLLSGQTDFVGALFESMSGLTTTGATIFPDVSNLPPALLLWRSITQWVGGLGIVLVVTVVLSFMESTGADVLRAEVSVISQKIKPRMVQTGLILAQIYVGLTVVQTALLYFGGLGLFNAVCHSLTTMATGGFSTHTESVGGLKSAYVEVVTLVFMILAATSFLLHYRLLRGELLAYLRSVEFRTLITTMLIGGLVLAGFVVAYSEDPVPAEQALREGIYQSVSFTTTTGYTTTSHTSWPAAAQLILVLLMFVGGSVGSTAGSLKIRRWIIVAQALLREIRRIIHPNRVVSIRIDDVPVEEPVVRKFVTLVLLWLVVFVLGGSLLMFMGIDPETAFTSAASCLGNVGPALGTSGSHMAAIPAFGKILLTVLMLVGRLELFIVIVLFSPAMWRRA